VFFALHQGTVALTERLLLSQSEPWLTVHLGIAALINALIAVFLFLVLDRLRKPS